MKSKETLKSSTSPQAALRAAKQLVGCYPHSRPPEPETYAGALAAVLAQYPLGVVEECVDPRTGLAREREFPPTVAAVVEWCDRRLAFHQAFAAYVPAIPPPPDIEYSDEHRQGMLARLSQLMHDIFDGKGDGWVRPIGPFEQRGDKWNDRRRGAAT